MRRKKKAVYNAGIIPRNIALKSHHFKQVYFPAANQLDVTGCTYNPTGGKLVGPPATAGAPDGFFSLVFQLDNLPQAATYASLFDAYRINKVVVKFEPYFNTQPLAASGAAGLTTVGVPQFLTTVIDYDDAVTPTAYTELMEYETFKESRPQYTHKRSITPACASVVYKDSGALMGYSQTRKKWIDIANTNVPHYGIKGFINSGQANSIQNSWKVFVSMYVSFKQTR